MDKKITEFINSQRVGVLAVEMPDGSPHAATVHFAYDTNSGLFLFETYRTYRKAEPLFAKEAVRATFVIGTDEQTKKTLQIDGTAQLVTSNAEKELFKKIYFEKFPEKLKKAEEMGENFVSFSFKPTWWRFTDWTPPQGKVIMSSEQ
jgi:uncharacterized protein YhbP (UPF0306 family)